jgi:hypothetical protein
MKGTEQNGQTDAGVLRWAGHLLSSDDLRRHLNGHRALIVPTRAIITPLASDELRSRGVRILREEPKSSQAKPGTAKVGVAQEKPDGMVQAALKALEREGLHFASLQGCPGPTCDWAKALAECVARGDCHTSVIFCADPGLVCCVANKLAGLRAAAVSSVSQAARAMLTVGANLLAVEMPGRTFFEVRQIMRNLATSPTACPAGVACTLKELETHAHR